MKSFNLLIFYNELWTAIFNCLYLHRACVLRALAVFDNFSSTTACLLYNPHPFHVANRLNIPCIVTNRLNYHYSITLCVAMRIEHAFIKIRWFSVSCGYFISPWNVYIVKSKLTLTTFFVFLVRLFVCLPGGSTTFQV